MERPRWTALAAACSIAAVGCLEPRARATEGFRSPAVFEALLPLKGEDRARQAAHFLALLARERGAPGQAAPPELTALGPRIVQAMRADGFEPSLTLALGVLGEGDWMEHLLERAGASDRPEELGFVARALAMIRSPAAVLAVRRLCRHANAEVRAEAMAAIAATADEGAASTLAEGLEDEAARVRWSAAVALAVQRGSAAGRAVLHQMLDRRHVEEHAPPGIPDRAAWVRRAIQLAASALVAIRDETAIEPLRTASLDDLDDAVRRACREAMEALLIPPDREPGRIQRGH